MAENRLTLNGLAELREQLRNLPPALVAEAAAIVQGHTNAAAAEIAAAYPSGGTGNLRQHLRVEFTADAVSATGRVKNTARHAYLYETGGRQQTRRWKSGKSTGIMPAAHTFIPIAVQRRRILLAHLIDLVERAGLHVSGAAG